jgi:hypothetical protein
MSQQSAVHYLQSKLDEERNTILEHIARGNVSDFPEYQRLCGVIQGIALSKQIITDLAKRLEGDADE